MIVVHHAPRARSLRVVWMLEEMGLPYETRQVALQEPRSGDFLRLNPTGMLPLVEDGAVRMVESIAILQYLADRYGPTALAVRPDNPAYPDYLQFMHLGEASLAAMLTPLFAARMFAPEAGEGGPTGEISRQLFTRRMALAARRLQEAPYMAGEAFTAADISVGYALRSARLLGIQGFEPQVDDYLARLEARPAFRRARAKGTAREPAVA